MPMWKDAAYGGETRIIKNDFMRVELHKRKTGWGWLEIYTTDNKFMGVLPFLSELQESLGGKRGVSVFPRRFESDEVIEEDTEKGKSFLLKVHSLTNYEFAKGSFVEYMSDKNEKPAITGEVRLTLHHDEAVLDLDYRYLMSGISTMVALRGPWVLAGANSFGQAKTDAIFPGIEWLKEGEWSSNRNSMLYPLAERTAPHPFKVSVPLMAVSYEGDGIGLAWDPLHPLNERRPMTVNYYPQPVFSSPDAENHANQHLLGLMYPSSAYTGKENEVFPKEAFSCLSNSTISFKAEVILSKGNSLDVLTNWVQRHGLPKPPKPRRSYKETLDFIAHSYNTNLWLDNKGWGIRLQRDIARGGSEIGVSGPAIIPAFIRQYLDEYGDTEQGQKLREKYEVFRGNAKFTLNNENPMFLDSLSKDEQMDYGNNLLSLKHEDGSFVYEPNNPKSPSFANAYINHLPFAENIHKSLGVEGDTALELNVIPAIHLLRLADLTKNDSFRQAALHTLDFCLTMLIPDGGDVWETPLHSPNLLATGHAAIAYELAFKATGKQCYRDKAIYWLRGFLVFTHLWEPKGINDLYCTKPCFCATDWITTSWVDSHVEWEVIQCLAISNQLGIDWAQVDTAIDWNTYEEGIVSAATHWVLDKGRADNLPYDIDLSLGNIDGTIADVHDPVTGQNFGWQLMPDYLAILLMKILKRNMEIG